jgi:hypothetical protein
MSVLSIILMQFSSTKTSALRDVAATPAGWPWRSGRPARRGTRCSGSQIARIHAGRGLVELHGPDGLAGGGLEVAKIGALGADVRLGTGPAVASEEDDEALSQGLVMGGQEPRHVRRGVEIALRGEPGRDDVDEHQGPLPRKAHERVAGRVIVAAVAQLDPLATSPQGEATVEDDSGSGLRRLASRRSSRATGRAAMTFALAGKTPAAPM